MVMVVVVVMTTTMSMNGIRGVQVHPHSPHLYLHHHALCGKMHMERNVIDTIWNGSWEYKDSIGAHNLLS